MSVSTIIINYNSREVIGRCLDSVFRYSPSDGEVIIFDNDSTDDSIKFIQEHYPNTRTILGNSNEGFARAINEAIRHTKSEYIILLNPDTVVSEGWIDNLVKVAESDESIAVVGSKLLLPNGKINSVGLCFSHRLCNAGDKGYGEEDHGQHDEPTEVLGVCFASALIRRRIFDALGGLDEKMFLYCEDLDFCIRARLRGYNVRYCPSSVVYHHKGYSGNIPPKYALRNRFRVLLKNYSRLNLLKYGTYSVLMYLIVSPLAYLRKGQLQMVASQYHVLLWNFINFPFVEREKIQRTRMIPDDELFKFSVPSRW